MLDRFCCLIQSKPMLRSKTVAIIGAGAIGLACAKVLLDDGFDVIIF